MAKKAAITNYKSVNLRAAVGKKISAVYDADREWSRTYCRSKHPPSSKMSTYNLRFGDRTLLVLDKNGNESISPGLEAELFGGIPHVSPDWTLALDCKTGQVCRLGYGRENRKLVAVFWEFEFGKDVRVPQTYLARLDELKSAKRPFCLLLNEQAALNFIEREYGYKDLRENIVIRLNFRKEEAIEIWGDSWRQVGGWKYHEQG